jgi:hypothetical protein
MQKSARKGIEGPSMKAPNHIAILAILTEMARNVSENISKVELKPLPHSLTATRIADAAAPGAKA